jgi:hypothetical protein
MNNKDLYPSDAAERFQVRLPPGLRDRIKAYAESHGRSMNTEIVRVLAREFPEPWPLHERIRELLKIVDVLRAGKSEAIDQLLHEFTETMVAVVNGRLEGLSDEESDRIVEAFDRYQEDYESSDDDTHLDPEEVWGLENTGRKPKFTPPLHRSERPGAGSPEIDRNEQPVPETD